jgi:hypothetical protein
MTEDYTGPIKTYAGIGSRKTPRPILNIMSKLASQLAIAGWTLRSGGAQGADSAFHAGVIDVAGQVDAHAEIYTAQHIDPNDEIGFRALVLAEKFHPNWGACSEYAKRLHARNGLILLGANLDTPAKAVYCWTPEGNIVGGTGQGLRIAQHYNIPIRNMGDETVLNEIKEKLRCK